MNASREPPGLVTFASPWQRFAAYVLDFVLWAPVMFLNYYLGGDSPAAGIVANLTNGVLWLLYVVYCHGRFGKTFGKHLVGLRVQTVAGERIGMGRAWARAGVDVAFLIVSEAGRTMMLASISDDTYRAGLRWLRPIAGSEFEPWWSQ